MIAHNGANKRIVDLNGAYDFETEFQPFTWVRGGVRATPRKIDFPDPGSARGWIVAFLFFPYGPFLYLVARRVITWPLAMTLAMVSTLLVGASLLWVIQLNSARWIVLPAALSIGICAIARKLARREFSGRPAAFAKPGASNKSTSSRIADIQYWQ